MRFLSLLFILLIGVNCYASPPPPGSQVYTIQVASLKEKEEAFKVLKEFSKFPDARVSYRKGRYKVRIGFFKSYNEALKFAKEARIKELSPDFYITRILFSPKGVYFFKGSGKEAKEVKKVKPPLKPKVSEVEVAKEEGKVKPLPPKVEKKLPEILKKRRVVKKESPKSLLKETRKPEKKEVKETFVYKESLPSVKRRESFNYKRLLYALPVLFFTLLFFLLKKFSLKGKEESSFEEYVSELLKKEDYERLIEVALPYLSKNPHDTFVKKALAESYENLGKYLEAAALYSEIGEELDRKGLVVLSEAFKKKAEELYKMEFKKG
ncbi:SPOR domain-containing protein [Thermovibrio sp.]